MFEQTKHNIGQKVEQGKKFGKKGFVALTLTTVFFAFQNNTDIPSDGVHGMANTIDSGSQDGADLIVKKASEAFSALGNFIKGENKAFPNNRNSHDAIGDFIKNGFKQHDEKQVGSFQNPDNAQKLAEETGGHIEIATVGGKTYHRVYGPAPR